MPEQFTINAGPGVNDERYDPMYWDEPEDSEPACLNCGLLAADHGIENTCEGFLA